MRNEHPYTPEQITKWYNHKSSKEAYIERIEYEESQEQELPENQT